MKDGEGSGDVFHAGDGCDFLLLANAGIVEQLCSQISIWNLKVYTETRRLSPVSWFQVIATSSWSFYFQDRSLVCFCWIFFTPFINKSEQNKLVQHRWCFHYMGGFSIKDRPSGHFVVPKCTYMFVSRTVEMKGGHYGRSEVHSTFRDTSPPQRSF